MTAAGPAVASAPWAPKSQPEPMIEPPVALELRRSDAGDLRGLAERRRLRVGDRVQHGVVKNDVWRHSVRACALEAPGAEPFGCGRPLLRGSHRGVRRGVSELGDEARPLPRPGEPERALRARHADIEQPALLVDLVRCARLPRGELLLLEPRDEDHVELEPLRPVQGQQVDSARFYAAGVEAAAEIGDERGGVAVERRCERDEATEVVLAHELTVAELVRQLLQPPCLQRRGSHCVRSRAVAALEAPYDPARGVAVQERRALEREPRLVQRLLEIGQPRIRAAEDRNLFQRHVGRADRADDRRALGRRRRECSDRRLRAVRARRAQHLLRPAESRDELVREREHLRRGAVVLLQPHDRRVREAGRDAEKMLRPSACERVDGLVVVADDAEIVAVAEPQVEQRLLQQVDVLIFVDGERSVLRAEGRGCAIVVLEQPHGALEQVFEIEDAVGFLAPLVVGVHARHQIDRDRRLAVLRDGEVLLGADAAILRPLDFRREVARRPELVRRAQAVADLAQEQRLRGQNPPELARSEVAELPERR